MDKGFMKWGPISNCKDIKVIDYDPSIINWLKKFTIGYVEDVSKELQSGFYYLDGSRDDGVFCLGRYPKKGAIPEECLLSFKIKEGKVILISKVGSFTENEKRVLGLSYKLLEGLTKKNFNFLQTLHFNTVTGEIYYDRSFEVEFEPGMVDGETGKVLGIQRVRIRG